MVLDIKEAMDAIPRYNVCGSETLLYYACVYRTFLGIFAGMDCDPTDVVWKCEGPHFQQLSRGSTRQGSMTIQAYFVQFKI